MIGEYETSSLHNFLPKPLAAFLHIYGRNFFNPDIMKIFVDNEQNVTLKGRKYSEKKEGNAGCQY